MADSMTRWFGLLGLMAFVAGCGGAISDPQPSAEGSAAWRKALGGGATAGGGAKTEEKKVEVPVNDGHANLVGVFKYGGDAPARPALPVGKDTSVCTPGGKQILAEDLVVDPASKGIAHCLIFVDKAPDSWIHESAKTAPGESLFDQKECVFLSHTFAFQTNQKIQLKNSDPILHNAAGTPAGNAPFNIGIPGGTSSTYSANKETAAPFQVKCTIHEWMSAWMIVRGNGYFAVTNPKGEFEMKNVPAGVDVTFRIWQEKSGFVSKPGVKLNGEELKLKGGRFTFKLDKADAAKNKMDLEFPPSVFQ